MSFNRSLMIAVSVLALATAQAAWAQVPATQTDGIVQPLSSAVAPSDPWAQVASDVPADPSVRYGQLSNGLRYALLHNATPPGQASLRVRIDAGSLMERNDQRGLAHFIEHMVFNGSTEIPEGELTRTLERLGLAFGADTNASTNFDQTIYQLDLPRTDDETVDTSLHILRQMVGDATLAPDAIDRERGIVLSEERTRAGPGLRSTLALLDFLMPGQLVPRRLPIGDTSVLQNAPRDRFAEFYSAYYRPSRTTIVAVGDFDMDAMEAKLRAEFAAWTPATPDGPEPDLGAVQVRGPEARVFTEAGVAANVLLAWVSPPDLTPDRLEKQRVELVQALGLQVLNRRLQSLARGETPPFVAASASRSTDLRSHDIASLYISFQPGRWAEGLAAAEQEQRRIVEYGVTQVELSRAITEIRSALENSVAGAATRRTPALANGLVSAVNADAVFVSPATNLQIFEATVANLTPDQVDAALKTTFVGSGPLVFVTSPDAIEGGNTAVLSALTASQAVTVAAPEARVVQDWPYADFGRPGAVSDRSEVVDLETTFVTFANGTRLTIKPTRFRDDQVMVSVRAGQGLLSLPNDRQTPLWGVGPLVREGGLGKLTAEQLDEVLAGRVYGASFQPGDDSYLLSGVTRPEDLDVQLQVLSAYLTDAAWRPQPFERTRGVYRQALPQLEATPAGVFQREVPALLHSGDARWVFPSAADIAGANPASLREAVDATWTQGPVEVIVVGDVDVDAVIAQVAATVGALPARPSAAVISASAGRVRFPVGTPQPIALTHAGRADQALGFVAWPTVDNYSNIREARTVRLLADVMRLRLIEELREGQAVTYSPAVGSTSSDTFADYGYLAASIEAPPEKLAGFFADVDRIAAALATGPITADELERARRPRIESLRRSQSSNEYWMAELQDAQTDANRLPSIRSTVADLERATPADLQRVAAQYLAADRAFRVQVTPGPDARPIE